jgi:hypothetical protein
MLTICLLSLDSFLSFRDAPGSSLTVGINRALHDRCQSYARRQQLPLTLLRSSLTPEMTSPLPSSQFRGEYFKFENHDYVAGASRLV